MEWPRDENGLIDFYGISKKFIPNNNWAAAEYINLKFNRMLVPESSTQGHMSEGTSFVGTNRADHISSHANQQNDILYGGGGSDLIESGKGSNIVFGGNGNDSIFSGTDRDTIYGGKGDDFVHGGTEDDLIFGGAGNDNLNGDGGNDKIFGKIGRDTISGDEGNDSLFGGSGDDLLLGGAGDDFIFGGPGSDSLFGGTHSDKLYGRAGNDWIIGGNGIDYLYGGNGDDTLDGGVGRDQLFGGTGADTFVIRAGEKPDRIMDWEPGVDNIYLKIDKKTVDADRYHSFINENLSFDSGVQNSVPFTTIWYDHDGPDGDGKAEKIAVIIAKNGNDFIIDIIANYTRCHLTPRRR